MNRLLSAHLGNTKRRAATVVQQVYCVLFSLYDTQPIVLYPQALKETNTRKWKISKFFTFKISNSKLRSRYLFSKKKPFSKNAS